MAMIRSTNALGFAEVVRELGADPLIYQQRFGLTPGVEHVEDAFVPWRGLALMLETAAVELDCPDLGLRMGEWQGLRILGPLAVLARNAVTVGDGLAAIGRYLYVHSPALRLTAGHSNIAGRLRFDYAMTNVGDQPLHQSRELSMANASRIVRLLAPGSEPPLTIAFPHEQLGGDAAYTQALRCLPEFGADWCGFEIATATAEEVIDQADPDARRVALNYLQSTYADRSARTEDRVRTLIRRLLSTGACSAGSVAVELHLHTRSMQRQLHDEGTTFGAILEDERRNLAARYLSEPDLPVAQIARLLGYTEQSAFARAFRGWFDLTPRAYRARL